MVLYLDLTDPKASEIISSLVGEYNFMLRYKFKDGRSLGKDFERLSGFAIDFKLSNNQLVKKEDNFLVERTVQ